MRRGGVIVKHDGALRFLPASIVTAITPCPPISRVPGAPKTLLGIVHTGGEIVPVVGGPAEGGTPHAMMVDGARGKPLLVCQYLGEPIGLLGWDVVSTGIFDVDDVERGVMVDGQLARPLDLAATVASLESARWTAGGALDG
jgi:chemotaxis signal transduction protein